MPSSSLAPRSIALYYLKRANRLGEPRLSDQPVKIVFGNWHQGGESWVPGIKTWEVSPDSFEKERKGLLTANDCVVALIDLQHSIFYEQ